MKSSEFTNKLLSKSTRKKLRKQIDNWKHSIAAGEFQIVLNAYLNNREENLYKVKFDQSWIYKTILDKKLKDKLEKCENIVYIGCGLYPYSLLDMFKRYPNIKYHGVEISEKRAILARLIVEETPAKGSITIYTSDGGKFDYSFLGDEDMAFISVDVAQSEVISQIVKTSGAQIFTCAPYKSSYLNGMFT